MPKAATSSIQVIDRVTALLEAITTHPEPASLKFLSAETRLHPSTAFRILNALASHGLVERTSAGRYALGVKLLHFGSHVHGKVDLLREAKPIMEALCAQVGETVNLTVREGDEVVYVERVAPNRMMRVEQVIGSRAPLHVTAVGKLFLAESGEKACREYARRTGLPRYTANTLTQVTKLWAQIANTHKQGFALDNEEAEQGVSCIGVPVRDAHGIMVAGLSISAPSDRIEDAWAERVRSTARQISTALGYRG